MINQINTERLTIRSTKKVDADFCLDIWLDEEMGKYLSDPPRDKAGAIYSSWKENVEIYDGCHYMVAISKDTGAYIGTCSLVPSDDNKVWDLGYCIHKDFWKQGFASEMISSLIEFCTVNGGEKITASVAKENIGSNAVLNKLGFRVEREGVFNKSGTSIYYDEYVYGYDLMSSK